MFRQRFRMVKELFYHIHDGACEVDGWFNQEMDGMGKPGISSMIKVALSLKMLANSASADSMDKLYKLSETTARHYFYHFCVAVVKQFSI